MPENKYQPLTPDQHEHAVYDSKEKPYHDEFKTIVLCAENLAMMTQCGHFDGKIQ